MLIANPIYDAAFKYLLDDTDIARQLLSVIIDEEIIELEVKPQVQLAFSETLFVKVLRLDFKAIIKTQTGDRKAILIELQKGKYLIDMMRFRRYLAENYQREEEVRDEAGELKKQPLPIITIYFLGFRLGQVQAPIVRVNRIYTNVSTNETLLVRDEFIEQLTHDCLVIQIPRLPVKYQSRVERILSVFNQRYVLDSTNRLLDFPVQESDEQLIQDMSKRLNKATENEGVRSQIAAQEDFDEGIERFFRKQNIQIESIQKAIEQNEKILQEKEAVIEQSQKALQDKEAVIEQSQKALQEKESVIEQSQKAILERDQELETLRQELNRLRGA